MKSVNRKINSGHFKKVLVYFLVFCLMFNTWLPTVMALEALDVANTSGVVPVQWGDHTIINSSPGAIIDWNNFDTATGQSVTFNQYDALGGTLSSTSAILNRITSGSATQFDGALMANGQVFIVNPAGVIFGSTATVNVTQLIASSLNITNEDFLARNYEFIAGAGPGEVFNQGTIYASEGAALIGKRVLNAGTISTSTGGFVVMAAGDRVLLGETGSHILVGMDSVTLSDPENPEGLGYVGNEDTGQISAPSGTVILAAGDLFSTALDVRVESGIGTVVQSGDIDADGLDGDGGSISLHSGDLSVLDSTSQTTANAGTNGDGGQVVVSSPGAAIFEDGARVEAKGGGESGDGGFFELSGKKYVKAAGDIDLTAGNGNSGMFLIDPLDLWIVDSDAANGDIAEESPGIWEPTEDAIISELDIDTLEDYLRHADVTLSTLGTSDLEEQNGDIIFDADRYVHTDVGVDNSLVVKAERNTTFTANDGIHFEGNGDVELYAGPEGSVTSVDRGKNPPNIWTRKGDIIIEAGRGGIDLGVLQAGTPSTSGVERPGEIRLRTVNSEPGSIADPGEYDITVQNMGVYGKGYGSVYVNSAGNLTINGETDLGGAVQVKTVTPPDDEDAKSFICLGAEKDVTIYGDVLAEAQGSRESIASIWIGAGTHTEQGGYPGTVTVNDNIQADASAAVSEKADATVRVYGSTINLKGNKNPEALGQGGVTYKSDGTGYVDSEDAVYEQDDPEVSDPLVDSLTSGSRAMVIIDTGKDSTCLECANIVRVALPVAVDDQWIDSKNIAVTVEVLFNDKESASVAEGSLVDGVVYLDSYTSENGGSLTLINDDTEVQYTPPDGWADEFADGVYTDTFYYYAVNSDGDVSQEPGLVTITLTNSAPIANPDYYDITQNADLEASEVTPGTIEGLLPAYADTDPDPGDTLTALLDGDGSTTLGGSVELNPDGTFSYTPPADAVGEDSFTYHVTDGYSNSEPTTVTITLTNEQPVMDPDSNGATQDPTLPPTADEGVVTDPIVDYSDYDPDEDLLTPFLAGNIVQASTDQGELVTLESPFIPVTPDTTRLEFDTSGCPALMAWAAEELGTEHGTMEIGVSDSLASTSGIQPCDVYGRLREAAVILKDDDGLHIAALRQIISEFAQNDEPLTEEQVATITEVITNNIESDPRCMLAQEYLDALAAYIDILRSELEFSDSESIQIAMDNYIDRLVEYTNGTVAAFISARLIILMGEM